MARVKLSEWKTKELLCKHTGVPFTSVSSFSLNLLQELSVSILYVVKVDQGVKKRFKNGLIELRVEKSEIVNAIKRLSVKGYTRFIIEPFIEYSPNVERYLSFERMRDGIAVSYSQHGGVEVEDFSTAVKTVTVTDKSQLEKIGKELQVSTEILNGLFTAFETYYFSFLEINPLVCTGIHTYFLDAACEFDSCAEFFVKNGWNELDFVDPPGRELTIEEKNIKELAARSTAAFMLKVVNPNAALFLLLNSGGSSIVIADEIFDKGYGQEIGNFGENSGSPSTEEAYIYSKNIVSLLLKSSKEKKALLIGGGVANFTDVRTTFKGVIQALEERKTELKEQKVKIFVRRGGPNQQEGLRLMSDFLHKEGLLGSVYGPEVILTQIVGDAINYLEE